MRSKLKTVAGYAPMRNHDARNPLMRKGGAHGKTSKAERHASRQKFVRDLRRSFHTD
jgi:hypothetical protein